MFFFILEELWEHIIQIGAGLFLLIDGLVVIGKCISRDVVKAKCIDWRYHSLHTIKGEFEYEYHGVRIKQRASMAQYHKPKVGEDYRIYVCKTCSGKFITDTTKKEAWFWVILGTIILTAVLVSIIQDIRFF